jgi:predicted mannosyl-3-phosphoglycerate phosphatase (HAD superfamily)
MSFPVPELYLRQTSNVLYIAVDEIIPIRGKSLPGLDEFTAALDHAGIPAVWLTSRSRLQFDDPRRKHGHTHPFIAEDGCAVYLPEDYFHLRPESAVSKAQKASTLRLGRFTCIPIAQALPASTEALETLSEDTGVPIVTLRSLSPRELTQNTGLSQREAELSRQRDFDDVFFFAGVSDEDIQRFLVEGRARQLQFRQHGVLWSAAMGASVPRCIRELSKLYDRALRYHAHTLGIATLNLAPGLFPSCERRILLCSGKSESVPAEQSEDRVVRRLDLYSPDLWERLLEAVTSTNQNELARN